MNLASTGPYHMTACPHCEELIVVREQSPAAGLRAVMAAFDAHLAMSAVCKAAKASQPTLEESLAALGEVLGPEGVKQMFQIGDEAESEDEGQLYPMEVTYALDPLPKSIFLAGPTPRSPEVPSWRTGAVALLRDKFQFNGAVFVPESADGKPHNEYDHQVSWEWEAINQATIVAFWIPRELETMPAFTTNVEFGFLVASGKVVMGAPADAKKMGYLRAMANRYNVPMFSSLEEVLQESVGRTKQTFGCFQRII